MNPYSQSCLGNKQPKNACTKPKRCCAVESSGCMSTKVFIVPLEVSKILCHPARCQKARPVHKQWSKQRKPTRKGVGVASMDSWKYYWESFPRKKNTIRKTYQNQHKHGWKNILNFDPIFEPKIVDNCDVHSPPNPKTVVRKRLATRAVSTSYYINYKP